MPYINEQAEADATAVLDTLGISEPPIDPIEIATELGIEVWSTKMSDDIAGMLAKRGRGRPEIYLNRADHPNRQRFTCAHELGHYYEREIGNDVDSDWDYVDYRNDLSAKGQDPSERYANGFAAALLMPSGFLRNNSHLSPRVLARLCEVSEQAMLYRLDNLNMRRL